MKFKSLAAVAFLALSLPASAMADAPICSVPVSKSITYNQVEPGYGEIEVQTDWKARRYQTGAKITQRVWVNGKLMVDDGPYTDAIMGFYELDALIGTSRKPRTVAFVFTVKSRDCTRTVRGFRSF